jgi:hypothetical protein
MKVFRLTLFAALALASAAPNASFGGIFTKGAGACALRVLREKLGWSHPWKDFALSNPREHQPGRPFRYLIHAVTGREGLVGVDLLAHPERLREVPILSSSFISEAKTMTYGNSGLIFEVPPERIYITAPRDIGTDNELGFKSLKLYRKMWGLDSPEALLRKTPPSRYNEVVVLGNLPNQQHVQLLKATGYFIKVDAHQKPLCSPERHKKILRYAQELNLPVVYIQENRTVPKGDGPNDLVL